MAIAATELKDFAQALAVVSSDEAQLRAAISRAYYAGFHSLLPFVQLLPRSKVCPERVYHVTHQEMSDRLTEWDTAAIHPKLAELTGTRGQLCRAIATARALRVKADYYLDQSITLGEAQTQVERARLILRGVEHVNAQIAPPEPAEGDAAA